MKNFKLALVQQQSLVGRKEQNFENAVRWAQKAGKAGADLLCLPELNITGHAGCPEMVHQAERVPDGPSVAALCEVARRLDLFICAGIAEDERGIHYNTQFLVGPDGYIGKQRKVHLSGDEYFFFRHGTDVPVMELPMVRVGIIICYDNSFPELSRCLAVKGAELLLSVHAARIGKWPRDAAGRRKALAANKESWRRLHYARAVDNGCYVGLCDAVGRAAAGIKGVEANHAGGCMVVNPDGSVLAESRSKDIREEMLIAELDARPVAAMRCRKCFNLQTRRPEVFGALTEPTH